MTDPWDSPPAPGWWKASDGNWYPPQDQSQPPPPAPSPAPGQWAPPPPVPGGVAGGYGGPPGAVYYSPQLSQPQSSGAATAALVLGILSIVGFWTFGVGVALGIAAVVLGIIGRKRSNQTGGSSSGRATAGIVTGVLGVLGGLLFIAMVASVWPDIREQIEEDSRDGICEPDNPWDPDC